MIYLSAYQQVQQLVTEANTKLSTLKKNFECADILLILKESEKVFDQTIRNSDLCFRAKLDLCCKIKNVADTINQIANKHFPLEIEKCGTLKFYELVNSEFDKIDKKESDLWLIDDFSDFSDLIKDHKSYLRSHSLFRSDSETTCRYIQSALFPDLNYSIYKLRYAYATLVGAHRLPCTLEGMSSLNALFNFYLDFHFFFKFILQIDFECFFNFRNIYTCLLEAIAIERELNLFRFYSSLLENSSNPEDIFKNSQQLEDIVHSIRIKIFELSEDDELMFIGGYLNNDPNRGHSVVLSITKESNDKYNFSITDSAGFQFYHGVGGVYDFFINNNTNVVIIENIEPETLLGDEFLRALVKLEIWSGKNISEFYKLIISCLAQGDKKRLKEGISIARQVNGTCSYHCLLGWLEGKLSETLFHVFKLFSIGTGLNILKSFRLGDPIEECISEITTTKHYIWPLKDLSLIEELKRIGLENFEETSERFKEIIYCLPGNDPYRLIFNDVPNSVKKVLKINENFD